MTKIYYSPEIVESYGKDRYKFYTTARQKSAAQLQQAVRTLKGSLSVDSIVDVAVGKGAFLADCAKIFTIENMIGNDISLPMLDYAKKQLPQMQTIHGSALDIDQHVHEADIVSAHFVLSYLPADMLLQKIHKTLLPNGLLSIATTTHQNLKAIQQLLETSAPYLFNFEKICDKHTQGVPKDPAQFYEMLQQQGFEVLSSEEVSLPVELTSFADMWELLVEDAWGVQYFDFTGHHRLNKLLARAGVAMLQLLHKPLRFPVKGDTSICVATCRKVDK